jgi:hypothetical protein
MYILKDERLLFKKQEILGEELSMSNLGHVQQEYDLLSEKIHHLLLLREVSCNRFGRRRSIKVFLPRP